MTIRGRREVYITDFGIVPCSMEALRQEAAILQRRSWEMHSDDLIGVPEVEADNNLVAWRFTRRAKARWERRDG
jgi:hypothetical protein